MENQCLLDEMVAEDSVEMLKAALPYLPARGQSLVSVFAKFLELQNTIRLFQAPSQNMQICAQSHSRTSPLEMLTACSKVCHGPVKEQLDGMINTLAVLQMFELTQTPASSDSQPKGASSNYE